MTQATEKRFDLQDGRQKVTFTGDQLAAASSQSEDSPLPRWTELAIYRTASGRYVLEKIGRSDLFHRDSCTAYGRGALKYDALGDAMEEIDPEAAPEDYFVACPQCQPTYELDAAVVVEQDMHKVDAYSTPEELIEALYHRKQGKVRSLSHLSRSLLEDAGRNDPGIAAILDKPVEIA